MSRRWLFAPLGVLIALPLVEAAFWMRDDGAFPHLNLYLADAELGVRVQPSSEMRLQLATNPVTTVRTNSRGYRGGEWPEPGAEEILVVGDSQVFGLGVEDDEVFAQGLAEATGRTVLNGGVPTYGPAEYQAVVEEVLAERPVTTVVVVVNFVNDLFELERPNIERHAVWDGWAVRLETAPESVVDFPGRAWLMGRSHAVFALRGLLRGDAPMGELPSEGSWKDLLGSGLEVTALHDEQDRRIAVEESLLGRELRRNEKEQGEVRERLDEDLYQQVGDFNTWAYLEVAAGDPGDIVSFDAGVESSRDVAITADHIRRAARLRRDWERQLRAREAREDLALREGLVQERSALRRQAPEPWPVPSVLGPWIEELGAVCTAGGADLVVVALPMDVQVSSRQWAKYDQPEQDLSDSLILLQDLVDHAHRLQMRALDATQALRGVGDGAFLDADIHMTPASHAALAVALAETLASPPPVKRPLPGIPQDRSPVPEPRDWLEAPEIVVRGSSKAGCWTLQIEEWLRITCRDAPGNHPTGIDVDHPEARVVVSEYAATLVVPLTRDLTADFHWDKRTQTLHVEGDKRWFSKPSGEGRALTVSKVDEDLCKCHISVNRERECDGSWSFDELEEIGYEDPEVGCEVSCETLYGTARDCDYQDCDLRLACAQGDLSAPPTCKEGEWNVLGLCQPLCDDEHPCEQGECTSWMGSGVCI